MPSGFVDYFNGSFPSGLQGTTSAERNAANDNICNFHPTKMGIAQ